MNSPAWSFGNPRQTLPVDGFDGALAGRVWRPGIGPSVVAIRQEGVFDISSAAPTMSRLAAMDDPARFLRAAAGELVGSLDEIIANTIPDSRNPSRPWLLAPIDLQVVKAAGVTFAVSMLERVRRCQRGGNHSSRGAAAGG